MIARVPQDHHEHHREDKQHRRHIDGYPGLHDFRRDQQVEQQDHREGQHEVGQERQHRVELAAVVTRRQAQRDADHEGKDGGEGRDQDHFDTARDDPAEHVAAQVVTAQQVIGPRRRIGCADQLGIGRAGQFLLHRRGLIQRIVRADQVHRTCEKRGVDPEQYQQQADHPDRAVEQFAIKAQLALVGDRKSKGDYQGNQCRGKLHHDLGHDAAPAKCIGHSCGPLM